MTREITDQLYIELGYYDPEEYFVYVAEAINDSQAEFATACDIGVIPGLASIDLNSEFTQDVIAGAIRDNNVEMVSESTVDCTLSNIYGVDLFAFSEAAIEIQVDLIRDNNIDASAVFDIATDGRVFRDIISSEDGIFSIIIDAERSREITENIQAAFSFDITVETIREFNSEQFSSFEQTIDAVKITDIQEAFESVFGEIALVVKTADYIIEASGFASLSIDYNRIRSDDGSLSSAVEITVLAGFLIDAVVIFPVSGVGKTIQVYGDTTINTSIKQVGTGSIDFDGTGDYLSLAHDSIFDLATRDFTIEFWIYNKQNRFGNLGGVVPVPLQISQSDNNVDWNWAFGTANTGQVSLFWRNNSNGFFNEVHTSIPPGQTIPATTIVPLNTWAHIALTYNTATGRPEIFVNGKKNASTLRTLTNTKKTALPLMFARTWSYYWGLIDEIRISDTVRYTNDFTPSTSKFNPDANTVLLVHGDEGITDESVIGGNIFTLTAETQATKDFSADLTSIASISAITSNFYGADLVAFSDAEVTANISVIRSANSELTSYTSMGGPEGLPWPSPYPTVIYSGSATINSIFAEDVSALKIKNADAQLSSTVSLTAEITRLVDFSSDLTSEFTIDVNVNKLREFAADFAAEFTQTTDIYVFIGIILELQAFDSISIRFGAIHIQESVYRIPPETRVYQINSETGIYTVNSETRIYKIRR